MNTIPKCNYVNKTNESKVANGTSDTNSNPDDMPAVLPADLYLEYKKYFEARNFQKIDTIITNIQNITQDNSILNIIQGQFSLYKGLGDESYEYLYRYISTATAIDNYALNVIAMWNEMAGFHRIALTQYSKLLEIEEDHVHKIHTLANAAITKKRLCFYDSALYYLERLLAIPDGYRMLFLIKIQIIHIYILKKQYKKALDEINIYLSSGLSIFVKRLKAYILYIQSNYNEILRDKRVETIDPYVAYIIARIGLDNPALNIDVPRYLDEALKSDIESCYIYNTYGNYYCRTNKFADAEEQYNNSLKLNPFFESAKKNIEMLSNVNLNPTMSIYTSQDSLNIRLEPEEADPDVENMGFLNINIFWGYSPFKLSADLQQKSVPLKFYNCIE